MYAVVAVSAVETACEVHRNGVSAEYQHCRESGGHEQQGKTENGVKAPDELVDGQQCGQQIVGENHCHPEFGACPSRSHGGHEVGWCDHEYGSHEHQQHYRQQAHYLPCWHAKLPAD